MDNQVKRYGINSKILNADYLQQENIELCTEDATIRSSKYKPEDARKVKHHSLEKHLLQEAINDLLNNENCKTVLIDIFARVNGQVKIEDGIIETHTVVLYKNPINEKGHKITVIDPSNFLFSSHLSALDIEISHILLEKITTIHKNLQIYRSLSNSTGPSATDYRDCIDIATKIAFGLNQSEWEDVNSDTAVRANAAIIAISNTSIDESIIVKKIAARIKQSSDMQIVKRFYEAEKVISKNLLMLVDVYPKLHEKTLLLCKKVLSTEKSSLNILNELVNCNELCIDEISTILHLEHENLKLIAEVGDEI